MTKHDIMTSCVKPILLHALKKTHNSSSTPVPRCQVPVPYAFSCRDLDVWGRFLDLLQRNAAEGKGDEGMKGKVSGDKNLHPKKEVTNLLK